MWSELLPVIQQIGFILSDFLPIFGIAVVGKIALGFYRIRKSSSAGRDVKELNEERELLTEELLRTTRTVERLESRVVELESQLQMLPDGSLERRVRELEKQQSGR